MRLPQLSTQKRQIGFVRRDAKWLRSARQRVGFVRRGLIGPGIERPACNARPTQIAQGAIGFVWRGGIGFVRRGWPRLLANLGGEAARGRGHGPHGDLSSLRDPGCKQPGPPAQIAQGTIGFVSHDRNWLRLARERIGFVWRGGVGPRNKRPACAARPTQTAQATNGFVWRDRNWLRLAHATVPLVPTLRVGMPSPTLRVSPVIGFVRRPRVSARPARERDRSSGLPRSEPARPFDFIIGAGTAAVSRFRRAGSECPARPS
jgi:hypothetical protein